MSQIDVPDHLLDINPITKGLLNAAMRISQRNKYLAEKPPTRPRYTYSEGPIVLHARRGLKRAERVRFEDAKRRLRRAQSREEATGILGEINDLPIKAVKTIRANLQTYGKDYRAKPEAVAA